MAPVIFASFKKDRFAVLGLTLLCWTVQNTSQEQNRQGSCVLHASTLR
jgi:hypothetical protein